MFSMEIIAEVVNLMLGFRITQIGPLEFKLWPISFLELSQLRLLTVCVQVLGLIFSWKKKKNLD